MNHILVPKWIESTFIPSAFKPNYIVILNDYFGLLLLVEFKLIGDKVDLNIELTIIFQFIDSFISPLKFIFLFRKI